MYGVIYRKLIDTIEGLRRKYTYLTVRTLNGRQARDPVRKQRNSCPSVRRKKDNEEKAAFSITRRQM